MFKHILVPTDGSQFSQDTCRRAVSFAKEAGAKITAFYAKPEYPVTYYGEGALIDSTTPEQFAEQIGASKSSVWELENKEKARPSADRINEVAKVLGVTPEFLMNDDVAEPSIDVADEAFFRKYQSLDNGVKQQLQEILSVLDKKAGS